MLEHITGPPVLRPHKRQRRLPMQRVRASEAKYIELKDQQRRDLELAYAHLALDAIRQRRSDEILEHLGDLVAASLSNEWRPILKIEPANRMAGGANENIKESNFYARSN